MNAIYLYIYCSTRDVCHSINNYETNNKENMTHGKKLVWMLSPMTMTPVTLRGLEKVYCACVTGLPKESELVQESEGKETCTDSVMFRGWD